MVHSECQTNHAPASGYQPPGESHFFVSSPLLTLKVPLWTHVPNLESEVQLLEVCEFSGPGLDPDIAPGTAVLRKQGKQRRLLVACAKDASGDPTGIEIIKVRGSGKKSKKNEMEAGEWWNGLPAHLRTVGQIAFT